MKQNYILNDKTVNLHFWQACRMKCKYCFAPKAKSLTPKQWAIVIAKLHPYFSRINFVGGEPTDAPYLLQLVKQAHDIGFKTSIVTNGFNLVHRFDESKELFNLLDGIGISVDSLNPETNRRIGRVCNKQVILREEYEELCKYIRERNIPLKINTVVSKLNLYEDFNSFYAKANPDRIKLFQVLKPNMLIKRDFSPLLISHVEFMDFVKRHEAFSDILCPEDNNAMKNSYYMIDSEGRFCDNTTGAKSPSLIEDSISVETALEFIKIDEEKYLARYSA